MGPPGLWKELRSSGACKTLRGAEVEKLLEGKKVAVDGAIWLYQAQLQQEVVRHFGVSNAAVKVVFERCVRWLRRGILPVVVLEGTGGGRAERVCSRGRGGLGPIFAAQPRVRALLDALGIPCVNADGEAEATCAQLVACGACDFAATEDFDALLFGAPNVLKKLDICSAGPSECELWEAATIQRLTGLDRRALIAAAFLIGCDYDCRQVSPTPFSQSQASQPSQPLQSQDREGSGVQGMGPRKAVQTARQLKESGGGDALHALRSMVAGKPIEDTPAIHLARSFSRCHGCKCCGHGSVAKKEHGKKGCPQCGTKSGCLPRRAQGFPCECSHCVSVARAGGEAKVQAARVLHRVDSKTSEEPGCEDGLHAVIQQYTRRVSIASKDFAWRGLREEAVAQSLEGLFTADVVAVKVQPLHFEWVLREIAAKCPPETRRPTAALKAWVVSQRLQYVPLQARCSNAKDDNTPHALVEWASATNEDMEPLKLSSGARHVCVSLARSCGLLDFEAARAPVLARTFARLLADCPPETRANREALLAWAQENNVQLVPTDGRRLRSRIEVIWSDTSTSVVCEQAKTNISLKDAEKFGGHLKAVADGTAHGQKSLKDFFARRVSRSIKDSRKSSSSKPAAQKSLKDFFATLQKAVPKKSPAAETSSSTGDSDSSSATPTSPPLRPQSTGEQPSTPRVSPMTPNCTEPEDMSPPATPIRKTVASSSSETPIKAAPKRRRWSSGKLDKEPVETGPQVAKPQPALARIKEIMNVVEQPERNRKRQKLGPSLNSESPPVCSGERPDKPDVKQTLSKMWPKQICLKTGSEDKGIDIDSESEAATAVVQ